MLGSWLSRSNPGPSYSYSLSSQKMKSWDLLWACPLDIFNFISLRIYLKKKKERKREIEVGREGWKVKRGSRPPRCLVPPRPQPLWGSRPSYTCQAVRLPLHPMQAKDPSNSCKSLPAQAVILRLGVLPFQEEVASSPTLNTRERPSSVWGPQEKLFFLLSFPGLEGCRPNC